MILSKIIEAKKGRIEEAKKELPLEKIKEGLSLKTLKSRDFKHAISRPHDINLIAEIKRASPTRGLIRKEFNLVQIAEAYQISGASAISVLTEEDYFLGQLDYIRKVREVSTLPVLRKDFILEEYQIYESALAEADAVLLIADILSKEEMERLYSLARSLNMAVLSEVHAEEDLEKAIAAKADIIGINNRDLHTFKLNADTTPNLVDLIPKGRAIVSESGIRSRSDALFLKSLGVNAVLVGEVFMDAEDIGARVREFVGR